MGRSKKDDFRPVHTVQWAEMVSGPPPFARRRPRRVGARGQGIRYEERAQAECFVRFGEKYLAGPWFKFGCNDQIRHCQPDGLYIDPEQGLLVLNEIKYQHTYRAWQQLHQLYIPVVQKVFESAPWTIKCFEMVKWYDPAAFFPGPHILHPDPINGPSDKTMVLIWRP